MPRQYASLDASERLVAAQVPLLSGARVYSSVVQTIANSTFTALTFDTEVWDEGGYFDPAAPTRLTAASAGLYALGAYLGIQSVGTSYFSLSLRLNGPSAFIVSTQQPGTSASSDLAVTATAIRLAAGDYMEALVYQTSGVSKDTVVGAPNRPGMWMVKVGA